MRMRSFISFVTLLFLGSCVSGSPLFHKKVAEESAAASAAAAAGNITQPWNEAYVVESLPGVKEEDLARLPVMHAGQVDTVDNETGLFFWRYARQPEDVSEDLIVWFNGGPGCSSMDGTMMEIGPFRPVANKPHELEWNDGTWLKAGDLLFIDQPAGTGFAYTDDNQYDTELTTASQHVVKFFEQYAKLFPNDTKKKIYFAGESYAGQYIPYFADALLNSPNNTLEFGGLLIGNGWIEPDVQSLSYVPFALQNKLIDKSNPKFSRLLRQHERCQNAINDANNHEFEKGQCARVLDVLSSVSRKDPGADGTVGTCYNVYDYRKQDSYPACGANWPELLPESTEYLNWDETQEELNIRHSRKWSECNEAVFRKFAPSKSKKSFELLPSLMEKVPIMLFNGDKDIICNHVGTEMLIEKLEIDGKQGFANYTPTLDWKYDGVSVGTVRSEQNLTYVRVFNSSHMVPYDLPEVSLGLMDLMFKRDTLGDSDDDVVTTPVHDDSVTAAFEDSGSNDSNDSNDSDGSDGSDDADRKGRLSIFFWVDTGIVIVFAVSVVYRRKKKQKQKRVHWNDDSEADERSEGHDSEADERSEGNDSVLSGVLSKLGYGNKNRYMNLTTGGDHPDIEMGDVDPQDQFVVSDDDDEDLKD